MDGLSVAASVAGLLAITAKVTISLIKLKQVVKDAHKQAQDILDEVNSIKNCLSTVFHFIKNTDLTSRSHASLLTVEQIMVSPAECVFIFSDLEEFTNLLDLEVATTSHISLPKQIRLMCNEPSTNRILTRLQSARISLNCMLTILSWSVLTVAIRGTLHLSLSTR